MGNFRFESIYTQKRISPVGNCQRDDMVSAKCGKLYVLRGVRTCEVYLARHFFLFCFARVIFQSKARNFSIFQRMVLRWQVDRIGHMCWTLVCRVINFFEECRRVFQPAVCIRSTLGGCKNGVLYDKFIHGGVFFFGRESYMTRLLSLEKAASQKNTPM